MLFDSTWEQIHSVKPQHSTSVRSICKAGFALPPGATEVKTSLMHSPNLLPKEQFLFHHSYGKSRIWPNPAARAVAFLWFTQPVSIPTHPPHAAQGLQPRATTLLCAADWVLFGL